MTTIETWRHLASDRPHQLSPPSEITKLLPITKLLITKRIPLSQNSVILPKTSTMSIQDRASHQISQLDKEVRLQAVSCPRGNIPIPISITSRPKTAFRRLTEARYSSANTLPLPTSRSRPMCPRFTSSLALEPSTSS